MLVQAPELGRSHAGHLPPAKTGALEVDAHVGDRRHYLAELILEVHVIDELADEYEGVVRSGTSR